MPQSPRTGGLHRFVGATWSAVCACVVLHCGALGDTISCVTWSAIGVGLRCMRAWLSSGSHTHTAVSTSP